MKKDKGFAIIAALAMIILLAVLLIVTNVFGLLGPPRLGSIIRRIGLFGTSGFSSPAARLQRAKTGDVPPGTWAIYVYMCGSNLESEYGCATADLNEVLSVALPESVTVVIEAGGSKKWRNSLIDSSKLDRVVYTKEGFGKIESLPSASMGSPDTLTDFLLFCNENYPAENQALIFWNHGGGSLNGVSFDERFNYDPITLPEMRAALESVPAASGIYEVIGFDACLMATVDVVEIISDKANYLVASQEIEPGIGWNYTGLLSALAADPSMDGAQLGRVICDTYYATCEEVYETAQEVTLSVIDLSRAEGLIDAYHKIGDEALLRAAQEEASYLSAFARAALNSQVYGGDDYDLFGLVDLGDLVKNAAELLPKNSRALLDALEDCVIYQVKGEYRERASGVTCSYNFLNNSSFVLTFMKLNTNKPFAYYYEYAHKGTLSENAQAYIKGIADQANEPEPIAEPLPQTAGMGLNGFPVSIGPNGHWQMDMGPERAASLAAVYVKLMYVYLNDDGDESFRILFGTGHDVTSDFQNGVFTENFTDVWGSLDGWNVYMEPIGTEDGRILYAVPILLNSEMYSMHVGYTYDAEGNGAYEILGAWKVGDEKRGLASKTLRRLMPGDVVEPIHYPMLLDEKGEWYIDYDPPMPMGLLDVSEGTRFYDRSVGDGYFALFFEMIDYAGNHYFSGQCSFRVRNGQVKRLPEGISFSPGVQPDGSVSSWALNAETGHDPDRNMDFTYYTATVTPETYAEMRRQAGLPPSPWGDTMTGMGYTIQVYSDVLDLSEYVGILRFYMFGECFAANSPLHRRDIVFRVTEIIDLW